MLCPKTFTASSVQEFCTEAQPKNGRVRSFCSTANSWTKGKKKNPRAGQLKPRQWFSSWGFSSCPSLLAPRGGSFAAAKAGGCHPHISIPTPIPPQASSPSRNQRSLLNPKWHRSHPALARHRAQIPAGPAAFCRCCGTQTALGAWILPPSIPRGHLWAPRNEGKAGLSFGRMDINGLWHSCPLRGHWSHEVGILPPHPQLRCDTDIKNVKRFTVKSTSRPGLRWLLCSCFAFLFFFSPLYVLPPGGGIYTNHCKNTHRTVFLHLPNYSATPCSQPTCSTTVPIPSLWGNTYGSRGFPKKKKKLTLELLLCYYFAKVTYRR